MYCCVVGNVQHQCITRKITWKEAEERCERGLYQGELSYSSIVKNKKKNRYCIEQGAWVGLRYIRQHPKGKLHVEE